MIRVALYFVLVGVVALGIAWFADRPGEVAVTWQGLRVETSVMVALVAFVAALALSILLWSILRGLLRAPRRVSEFWHRHRREQGYRAITRGLLAVGSGDTAHALRSAEDAKRLASSEPLTLLLGAQAAQLAGDRTGADRAFRKMAEHGETRLLGLRGLFVEAQRRDDADNARLYAEEAARLDPSLPWAGQAVLQFRCAAGDWTGAIEIVERNRHSGAIDKNLYRRQRAVLLTAQAMAAEESDRDLAKTAVLEAVKLAPDLVPAVTLAARFLSEAGDIRKAARMIENAWEIQPHPDLADSYIHVRLGDSARERLARAKRLNERAAPSLEGALALARAAIDAREFVQAREALFPYLDKPTQRVAILMAGLEQAELGDEGRAREWTARALRAERDPVWTADGIVSETWLPLSPVTGRLDAFEWKVPLAQIGQRAPALDLVEERVLVEDVPAAVPVLEEQKAPATPAMPPQQRQTQPRVPADDIVLPTAPVPDDPGPGPEPEREPLEPVAASSGWRRFFSW